MGRTSTLLASASTGLLALGSVIAVSHVPVSIEPGSSPWRRMMAGVGEDGRIGSRAVGRLPGLSRHRPATLEIQLAPREARRSILGVSLDREPLYWIGTDSEGKAVVRVPPSPTPGLRLEIHRPAGAPPIEVKHIFLERAAGGRSLWAGLLALLATTALSVWISARLGMRAACSAGWLAAGILSLLIAPSTLFLLVPQATALLRIGCILGLLVAGTTLAFRLPHPERRAFGRGAALLLAITLGAWPRVSFAFSAGSWDTEYWKAWMLRAAVHGVGNVYGESGTVPEGHFLAQLRGEEPTWNVRRGGRELGVDYPPLAMVLWRGSWELLAPFDLTPAERENVASKLPALAGDVAAVLVLWWALAVQGRRRDVLAVVYWALPISWLSSAVLGYQDATYAPFAALAVVAAGRGRPFAAGALLALASLVKPLAILIVPAVGVALLARRTAVADAARALAGAACSTLLVVSPFFFAGTVPEMTVHVIRAFSPGNLSSGCANAWWLVSHLLTADREARAVPFVRLATLDLPWASIATAVLLIVVAWVAWQQRRFSGPAPTALAAGTMLYAYSMVSVGVYENHAHVVLLLLFMSGLVTSRLRVLTSLAGVVYVLNLLALSGLGRFYGNRHLAIEPLARDVLSWRLAMGFDFTLLLAAVNLIAFAVLLGSLREELAAAEGGLDHET